MGGFLKQSTAAQSRALGPFLDDTDFTTAETGLTIANTDIKLVVNGGASADKNSGGGTHRVNGVYGVTFDATDTATVGEMFVSVKVAGALPVFASFTVLEEAVYDELFGASALGYIANAPVNVAQISGDSTAADNLETLLDDTAGQVPWAGIIDQGTAQSATGTTLVLRAGAAFADDEIIGATIFITGGTGVGQARTITDYVSATDTATVDTWTTTPSGTITYKIFATAPSSGGGNTAAEIRDALGLASANLDTQLSGLDTKLDTIDNFLDTEVAAILADTNELQTDWADGGRLDLILDARASQTSVNTIDDFLDTEIAAIKAKTDSLTFTVAGQVDANVQSINDVTITGNGQSGTEFGV